MTFRDICERGQVVSNGKLKVAQVGVPFYAQVSWCKCQHQWWCQGVVTRVSYRGVGGALESSPPPPSARNLEIEYGYYCGAINISYLHVTGHPCKYVSSEAT